MKARPPVIRAYLGDDDIIVDSFAGGGGVSEAFRRALGRSPDHAINHNAEALAMHAANHPETEHHCGDIWGYRPRDLVGDRRVAAAWFSPDCKDHSTAKGGKPIDKRIRALAWVAVRWAAAVKPGIIFLENVSEFADWGPCIKVDGEWRRDPKRKGQTFSRFVRRLKQFYANVEWKLLRADDYGAPTKRKRLFLMASDRALVWPTPTHGPLLRPHRTAAECIDFTKLGASIFMTSDEAREYKRQTGVRIKRPLEEPSLHRIAAGIDRYVIKERRPFLIPVSYTPKSDGERRIHSVDEPMPTITAHGRGRHALISPVLYQSYLNINEPLGTVVACGQRHAMAAALLAPFVTNNNSVRENGGWNIGARVDEPMPTLTAQRQKALVAANLVKFAGTSPAHLRSSGWKVAQVAAFLVRYNGQSIGQDLRDSMSTLDTTDRLALVSVWIDDVRYVIADILMRMLDPRELFNASDFPAEYIIDPVYNGKPLTRTAQVRMCGNAVPPAPAAALIGAQFPEAA